MCIPPLLCLLATGVAAMAEPPLQLGQLVQEALRHNTGIAAAPFGQRKLVSRVKEAYYRLQHAYMTLEWTEHDRDLLRNLLRVAEAKYSNGKALEQDVLKAQVQFSLLEPRLIEAESELHAREAEINALLNRRPDSPLGRPQDEHPKDIVISLEELLTKAAEAGSQPQGDGIRDEYLDARNAVALMNVYDRTILPQSRFAAHASLVSYESGASDFLNVLADYSIVFDAERRFNKQVQEFSLKLVRLEELTGVELIH
jgi:outer membrane protein TolC